MPEQTSPNFSRYSDDGSDSTNSEKRSKSKIDCLYEDNRRIQICKLLEFTYSTNASGLLSSVNKGFLKELIVSQDAEVMATDLRKETAALEHLKRLIMYRTERSFIELFCTCPLEISNQLANDGARNISLCTDKASLVYEEIDFVSFCSVLQLASLGLKPCDSKGIKFYNFGSESGRAVFAACLSIDLSCAVGIESLESDHNASLEVRQRYTELVEPFLTFPPQIEFYHGDFMAKKYDWTDADLVLAHSTCFEDKLLKRISRKARSMRPGSRFVTFTHPLQTSTFKVIHERQYQMMWGEVTVFIQERSVPPPPPISRPKTSQIGGNINGSGEGSSTHYQRRQPCPDIENSR